MSVSAKKTSATKSTRSNDPFGDLNVDDDMKEISIEDLENDADLLGELRDLGWTEDYPVPSRKGGHSAPKSKLSAAAAAETSTLDFSTTEQISSIYVEEVDESAIELSEEDLNDPELLSQLRAFESNTDDNAYEDDGADDHAEEPVIPQPTSSRPTNPTSSNVQYGNIATAGASSLQPSGPTMQPGAVAVAINNIPLASKSDSKPVIIKIVSMHLTILLM